ncbi:MAG: hypothetical protein Greene041619_655 [Candidatus Peregrinibacteria bacterium Greene0416_19]|nr:MAG: hypothetical protein Greene041619_655 [Candidatus Peregrinibacteria bacterium Greene0416_19]
MSEPEKPQAAPAEDPQLVEAKKQLQSTIDTNHGDVEKVAQDIDTRLGGLETKVKNIKANLPAQIETAKKEVLAHAEALRQLSAQAQGPLKQKLDLAIDRISRIYADTANEVTDGKAEFYRRLAEFKARNAPPAAPGAQGQTPAAQQMESGEYAPGTDHLTEQQAKESLDNRDFLTKTADFLKMPLLAQFAGQISSFFQAHPTLDKAKSWLMSFLPIPNLQQTGEGINSVYQAMFFETDVQAQLSALSPASMKFLEPQLWKRNGTGGNPTDRFLREWQEVAKTRAITPVKYAAEKLKQAQTQNADALATYDVKNPLPYTIELLIGQKTIPKRAAP